MAIVAGEVFTWLFIASVLLLQAARAILVTKLIQEHAQVYRQVGAPSLFGRNHQFLFKLIRSDCFSANGRSGKKMATLVFALYCLPFFFAFGAAIALAFSV